MIQLFRFFQVLFLSTRISRDVMKNFAEDHINRLTGHNPGGIFTTILTAVTAAYNAYFGDLASESVNEAVKKGKTKAMEESREALVALVVENEPLVKYTYRSNPSVYQEFYPEGLEEYHQSSISNLQTIGERYKAALTAHTTDFPAAVISAFTTKLNTFVANRAAQLSAKGDVASERSDIAGSKQELAQALTLNVLTIATHFLGDITKADVYFDQSILDAAFARSATKVEQDIDPAETQNVFDNISAPTTRLRFRNNGDEPLLFACLDAEDTAVSTSGMLLAVGGDVTMAASDLGWTSTSKFLNVTNPGTEAGAYTVEKV